MQMEAKKYLMIWMMLYVCSLALVKISICVTMLRIGSPIKVLRICVYTLLAFTLVGYFFYQSYQLSVKEFEALRV